MVEKRIPTGPATKLIQKGGGKPPIEITIGLSNTLGMSDKETIRLKIKATTGINLLIFFEISPNKGKAKARPKGTTINSTGFTIFDPLFYEG